MVAKAPSRWSAKTDKPEGNPKIRPVIWGNHTEQRTILRRGTPMETTLTLDNVLATLIWDVERPDLED